MKKRTRWAALLSAAALLTLGMAMTAAAATSGWYADEGSWVYLDSDGSRVTDQWKKSGDSWYYLNSDGTVAVSQWIDDTYCTDESGAMRKNQWVYVEMGDDGPATEESGWFYLDSSGKVVTDSWKTINENYYHFDSDGSMMYGWYYGDDGSVYYLGDENDGVRKTGWQCLEFDEEDLPEDRDVSNLSSGDGTEWFYFQDNGKMVKADDSSYATKNIGSYRYYFDENGVMITGWAAVASASDADATGISSFKYFGEDGDGTMAKGWKYLSAHPKDSDDSEALNTSSGTAPEDGEGYWYYFDSNGIPKYLASDGESLTDFTTRVSSNAYFFDEYGCMQYGLLAFTASDGETMTAYFGSSDSDGKMKTGKQTSVYDGDDETETYYFETSGSDKGAGITGVKDDYLYYNGILVKADSDTDYEVFEVKGKLYLVNEAGKIQTSNKYYKSDGVYKYEYSSGMIYLVDEDKERTGEVTEGGDLPVIIYDRSVFAG